MKFLKILTSLVFAFSLNISLNAKEIKMGKADWDTGYFQAEVYKKALEKMQESVNFEPNPSKSDKGFFDRVKEMFS